DHQDQIALGREIPYGPLTVGRRVADVFRERAADVWVLLPQGGNDRFGVIHAECRLCEISDTMIRGYLEFLDFPDVFDDVSAVGCFAQRADDLIMVPMADQHDGELLARVSDGLGMNLSHEGAGGIDLDEIAILCLT